MPKGWILSEFGKLIQLMSSLWFGLVGLVLDSPSFEHAGQRHQQGED
jgi:hypothetical protein